MFIKFNDVEIMDFFEQEPVCIGDYEEGNWIYTLVQNSFKLVLLVDTYRMVVEVSVSYLDNLVCSGIYKNVQEIRKSDNMTLRIIMGEENSIILKKGKQIGVVMEEN